MWMTLWPEVSRLLPGAMAAPVLRAAHNQALEAMGRLMLQKVRQQGRQVAAGASVQFRQTGTGLPIQGWLQPPGAQPPGAQPPGMQPPGAQPPGGQPPGGQPLGGQPLGGQPLGGQPPGPQPAYRWRSYIHLPSHVRWSQVPTARQSASGRYYLIIPFVHLPYRSGGAANTGARARMPWKVYQLAKRLKPGESLDPGMPPYVPRLVLNRRSGYQHTSIYAGMRRVPRRGRGGGSRYLTFRTMTPNSPGWWIPVP